MSCGCTFSTDLRDAPGDFKHKPLRPQQPPISAERGKLTAELLNRLPKAHLHCHLDGAVRPATLIELAAELGITHTGEGLELPTTVQGAQAIMRAPKECDSLVQYLKAFDVSLSVMQHGDAVRRIVVEACEDAVADGVRYIELRFAPMLHTKAVLTLGDVMDAVLEGKAHAELALPIVVGVIVCGIRHIDPAVVEQQASLAWRYRDRGVVGFDLAGPEAGFSSLLHERAFNMVRKGRLNCTLHSAEAADWTSAHDSVLQCGAQRLGHGVRMDPMYGGPLAMVQWCADRQIAVEVCLTSNVQTKAISSFDRHPVSHFLELGIPCAVSCDNTTVSGTTLTNEYVEFCKWYDLSPTQVIQLIDDGFKAAFARPDIRKKLRRGAVLDALRIMQMAGIDIQPAIVAMRPFHADMLYRGVSTGSNSSAVHFLTAERLAMLPKADVGVCLVGSVPLPTLVAEIAQLREEATSGTAAQAEAMVAWQSLPVAARTVQSVEDLLAIEPWVSIFGGAKDDYSHTVHEQLQADAHLLCRLLLQTPGQIRRGVAALVAQAQEEGYVHVELVFRPTDHCENGLTAPGALEVALEAVQSATTASTSIANAASLEPESEPALLESSFTVGLVISLDVRIDEDSTTADTSVNMQLIQKVIEVRGGSPFAVAKKHGESAGSTADESNGDDTVFAHTVVPSILAVSLSGGTIKPTLLRELKRSLCPVVVSIGQQEQVSGGGNDQSQMLKVVDAVQLGAARIRKLYTAHKEPEMLDYLASRRVPLQLQLDSPFMFQMEAALPFQSAVAPQGQGQRSGSTDWWEGARPLNFLLNMDVPLTIASGAKAVHPLNHLNALSRAIVAAERDLPQSLMLLAASFQHSFLPYHRRRDLLLRFWAQVTGDGSLGKATGKTIFGPGEGLTQRPIVGAKRLTHLCNLAPDPAQ